MEEQKRLDLLAEDLNNQLSKIFNNKLLNQKQMQEHLKNCLNSFINSNRLDPTKGYSIDFSTTNGKCITKLYRNKSLEGMIFKR